MEAKILKKSIDQQMNGFSSAESYLYFIKKTLKAQLVKEEEKYFLVKISDKSLHKQAFHNQEWYQSEDKQFGLFRDETMTFDNTKEKGWRVIFQRR